MVNPFIAVIIKKKTKWSSSFSYPLYTSVTGDTRQERVN